MPTQCYFLEELSRVRRSLRRYCRRDGSPCSGRMSYHDASVPLDEADHERKSLVSLNQDWPHDDPRWPKACSCGYQFADDDEWQLFCERLFRRSDNGEITTLRDAPPGAMWYADWFLHEGSDWYRGPDGHCLVVRCPDGHDWMPDSRASNCQMSNDNDHKCWIRHGTVPNITVDKNGKTCPTGAGSIQTENWHGFLTNGVLDVNR